MSYSTRPGKGLPTTTTITERQNSSSSNLNGSSGYTAKDPETTLIAGWSRSKLLLVAGAAAAALIAMIVIPTAYCFSSDGRCGRGQHSHSSSSSSRPSATTSITYPAATATPLVTNANPILLQGFEWYMPKDGKHWSRLQKVLPDFHDIGISALWIPPPTKAATANSIGYDVYDLWDLGEFDAYGRVATAMGNRSELLNLSLAAHKIGIGLVVDATMNHRAGADSLQECTVTQLNSTNRLQAISPSRKAYVWAGFNFTSRKRLYSNKTWGCDDFTAVDWDDSAQQNGLFKINDGDNDFETDVSLENGNYDYLSLTDVAFRNSAVRDDVKAWGTWVTNVLGLSGFRLDAAKHISQGFIAEWITNITNAHPNQNMLFASEFWSGDINSLVSFLEGTQYKSSAYDVALLAKFQKLGNATHADITTLFNNDTLAAVASANAVTFVANHDTQPGQTSDNLLVLEWFKPLAYSFVLLRSQGYPCIFYGDIVGTYDAAGQFSKPSSAHTIAALAVARTYFAYGDQHDYQKQASNIIGWTRTGNSSYSGGNGVAVTMGNSGTTASLNMFVGSQHAGETWSDILGNTVSSVAIGSDGFGKFAVPANNMSVYVDQDAWQKIGFDASAWSVDPYSS